MAGIEFRNICKSFGSVKVMENLNLTIEDGKFTVLVGPSGCGKTTLLRIIAGIGPATSGECLMEGKDITDLEPAKRGIAMVFQNYALYPTMNIRENIVFGLKNIGMPKEKRDKLVNEYSEIVGLLDQLHKSPSQLSGGQRQRVALRRALVRDPQVFLLDEPLGNLDAKLRDQVRYELKKIQEQLGITTIYVTHDQTEAMTMADHIVLMRDGYIMQQGTPNELYDHPANEFVAGFLGTPQINLFSCDVKQENGKLILDAGAFRLEAPDSVRETLKEYAGQQVDLGVRPSDFEQAKEEANAIHAHVDSVEPLGDAYLIYVRVGDKVVVYKNTDEQAPTERELLLKPNMAKLHLFDPKTQKRINS